MFKFRIMGIPVELHRTDVGYRVIDTETGEARDYRHEGETIVYYFTEIMNRMAQRGFRDIDFTESDGTDVPKEPETVDRTAFASEIEEEFRKIVEAAKREEPLPCEGFAERYVYRALIYFFRLYRIREKSEDEVRKEMNALKTELFKFKKEQKQLRYLLNDYAVNIKQSGEILRYLNQNIETAEPEELLMKAIEYICRGRGEMVTYNNLKRRYQEC